MLTLTWYGISTSHMVASARRNPSRPYEFAMPLTLPLQIWPLPSGMSTVSRGRLSMVTRFCPGPMLTSMTASVLSPAYPRARRTALTSSPTTSTLNRLSSRVRFSGSGVGSGVGEGEGVGDGETDGDGDGVAGSGDGERISAWAQAASRISAVMARSRTVRGRRDRLEDIRAAS